MSASLNQLQARRAQLMKELAEVEEAIANFADASPVEIITVKNLRNSPGITWLPEEADRHMVVYSDEELTVPAEKSSHGGWVSKSALAEYKRQNPNWRDSLRVLE